MEQRDCCPDLLYTMVQPVSHSSVPFLFQILGCLSEILHLQSAWPLCPDDCPSVDIHGLQEVFVANYLNVDLLGEERQPVGIQLAGAEGRSSLRGGLLCHFLHLGHVGLLAGQLLLLLGLQWTVEHQTTLMEVCFLFACRHVACLPQLCEEHQMPGGSVSLLDYTLWL